MPKKSIKPSSRKQKGRRFQQWVAKQVSEVIDIPWGKDELVRSREMGQTGPDIALLGEAKSRFPFSVECKYQETWSVPAWIKQAEANAVYLEAYGQEGYTLGITESAGKEGIPNWLLFCKKSHERPVVVMDAEAFFIIYKILNKFLGETGCKYQT